MQSRNASETSAIRALKDLLSDEEARRFELETQKRAEHEAQAAKRAKEEAERLEQEARRMREREQAEAESRRRAEAEETAAVAAAVRKVELEAALTERLALEKLRIEAESHQQPSALPPSSRAPRAGLVALAGLSLVLACLWLVTLSHSSSLESQLLEERSSKTALLAESTANLVQARGAIEAMSRSFDASEQRLRQLKDRCSP